MSDEKIKFISKCLLFKAIFTFAFWDVLIEFGHSCQSFKYHFHLLHVSCKQRCKIFHYNLFLDHSCLASGLGVPELIYVKHVPLSKSFIKCKFLLLYLFSYLFQNFALNSILLSTILFKIKFNFYFESSGLIHKTS